MQNIKIYDIINSEIAIDVTEASNLSKTIIQRYNESHSKVSIDFSEVKSLISPFMRSLLRPLISNNVTFEGINFYDEKTKNTYDRILNQLTIIWTENIKEINT